MPRHTKDNRYRTLESIIRAGAKLRPDEALQANFILLNLRLRRRNQDRQWHVVEHYAFMYVLG